LAKKLGNGRTTAFSHFAMWLASNPEQSSPDKRPFEKRPGKFFVATWRAIFRRAADPRLGRDLAAYWPHERAEGPAMGRV
jgi:hypothetical protein